MRTFTNMSALREWIAKRAGMKKDSLRMDVLLQFGFLALVLWVIVENSPAASTAFASILTAARTAVTNLFTNVGNI